jgi:hypothetical protein
VLAFARAWLLLGLRLILVSFAWTYVACLDLVSLALRCDSSRLCLPWLALKHTTCSGFIVKLSTTRPRQQLESTSFDKDDSSRLWDLDPPGIDKQRQSTITIDHYIPQHGGADHNNSISPRMMRLTF